MSHHKQLSNLSTAGLLISLGIIFGDIGTSPLYVMKAIIGKETISELMVYGGISCVFWTLTLMTTIKYVLITLRADNKGEGGIFSLYTLVRKQGKWLRIPAIIGGATLLADGMITPPVSVSSAIEGLELKFPGIPTVPIVIIIISILFLFQRFGTAVVGRFFGPVMFVWFSMLGVLGFASIMEHPEVLKALNPYYAFQLLTTNSLGFWILGSVFLCTTGAEALYSDLGHCGRKNIQVSWIFVKICLVLNYFGQGAFLLKSEGRQLLENPFYGLMPEWFLLIGIGIATLATIIASQALITGSFTLISEAIRLDFYPKVSLNYPSNVKGQLYIPSINFILWLGCILVVLLFRNSGNMEAAYGLSITITMISTTILLIYFLKRVKVASTLIWIFFIVYFSIEVTFLISNLAKFFHGGYFTILLAGLIVFLMVVMYKAKEIKQRFTQYVSINDYKDQLVSLSNDHSIPKYSTHLVFLSNSKSEKTVEQKIMYSILQKQPKRADIYWFVHIEVSDEPYTMDYEVTQIAKEDVIKIVFKLGFRVQQRINIFMRKVVEDLVNNHEIDVTSRYHSLKERKVTGDFRFIIVEEILGSDNELPFIEKIIMNTYINVKSISAVPTKWFGLDTSATLVEKVPLVIKQVEGIKLRRLK
jgi:KUP system potassium uptake protein